MPHSGTERLIPGTRECNLVIFTSMRKSIDTELARSALILFKVLNDYKYTSMLLLRNQQLIAARLSLSNEYVVALQSVFFFSVFVFFYFSSFPFLFFILDYFQCYQKIHMMNYNTFLKRLLKLNIVGVTFTKLY